MLGRAEVSDRVTGKRARYFRRKERVGMHCVKCGMLIKDYATRVSDLCLYCYLEAKRDGELKF